MFTAKESTQLLDANQRLMTIADPKAAEVDVSALVDDSFVRALHIQKAKAQQAGDQTQLDELQAEIDELTDQCDAVIDSVDAI